MTEQSRADIGHLDNVKTKIKKMNYHWILEYQYLLFESYEESSYNPWM